MAKFWFVSAPLYSHTDWGGFLKTALVLQAQGHDVIWVSQETLKSAIEQKGLVFETIEESGWLWPPPPAPDLSKILPQEAVHLRYKRALDTWLSEDLVAAGVESLLALAEKISKPDAMIIDPFLSAAALAAEKLDVPVFVAGWTAQSNLDEQALFPVQRDLSSDSMQRLQRLFDKFGLEGSNFNKGTAPSIRSPHLHITYFTPEWYAAEQATMLPQTQYVGGRKEVPSSLVPEWLNDIPDEIPLAMITLGTIFTGDLGFFSWAAQAAAQAGLLPIVVVGWNPIEPEKKSELKRALPSGTRLLVWAAFEHVLPRCKLMIHHGGMGTTHAAIVYGLRQIVVPHAADQRIQGRRVAQAKLGLNLTAHEVQQGKLTEGAQALMETDWVGDNAIRFAEQMAALGGQKRAAELVLETMERIKK
jgi:UDP:flavonoid glycosyltransferase YjiC (YdhE family)